MMGSIFAGTDESPGSKFKIKGKFTKNIEEWDQLEQCQLDQLTDTFKKHKDKSKFVPEGLKVE